VVDSFMFPRDPEDTSPGPAFGETAVLPLIEGPCPSCTALLDQLDGAAEHAAQHINLAVVAKTPLPMLNVFHRDRGTIRHFWASELLDAPTEPGEDPRHVGTIEPLWNLFDLTREGRPADWYEQLGY
jgi:predicted dithiol-disulfide oxidoreductase (DUF899 family)